MRRKVQLAVLALAMVVGGGLAFAQQLGQGMDRIGIVEFHSDDERKLFPALICMCGCPREALDTCTCGYAHARRAELRAELAKGKTIEQIKEEYAGRFGMEALAVPPNTGANKLLYMVPIGAILLGAGGVVVMLRRWRRQQSEAEQARARAKQKAKGAAKGEEKPDEYDARLQHELKNFDGGDE